MTKKWTAEMTIKFLKGYEENSCLWDVYNQSYRSQDCREMAYLKLSQLMDIDGFNVINVKAKIRSIRNAYTLEIAKIWKSRRCGIEVYKPKVLWFPLAHKILHQVVQTQSSPSEIVSI